MNWVIFGARSYLGRQVVGGLRDAGAAVIGLNSTDCDCTDREAVVRTVAAHCAEPCAVLMLSVVNKGVDNSPTAFEANVAMVRHLVEATAGSAVRHLYFASSVDVYGSPTVLPITERTPLAPDSWYGMAKVVNEFTLRDAAMPTTILRFPGLYGPGPGDASVVGRLTRAVIAGDEVRLTGGGQARRDFVFAPDVAKLLLTLADQGETRTLNVATGDSITMTALVARIGAATGQAPRTVATAGAAARDFHLDFDTSALRAAAPDFAFTPLADGIGAYLTAPH
jgi:nucleoside-diphosphate-sugar epimerase